MKNDRRVFIKQSQKQTLLFANSKHLLSRQKLFLSKPVKSEVLYEKYDYDNLCLMSWASQLSH